MAGVWDAAIQATLQELDTRKLLRVQRPTIPVLSSSEAQISQDALEAWADGRAPLDSSEATQTHNHPSGPRGDSHPSSAPSSSAESSTQGTVASQTALSPLAPQSLRLFSLNDYLGLASHPDVCRAAADAAMQYGMGYRSAAIVGGTTSLHRELEIELARLKGTEDCLLFPTGFAANMAVVSSLAGLGPQGTHIHILSDELNHASIIDGARLATRGGSDVTLHVYRHNDMKHVEQVLRSLAPGTRAMVVTDSLFSMDGDFADLKGLVRLKRRYGFLLVVDEAHATLVVGDRGGGAAEALGVCEEVDVHVGTLSKACGALGGFVATSRDIKALLVNKGRAYVYSTALPVPVVAAALAALRVATRERWRQSHVWSLVHRLGKGLGVPALSPVVPLVVGSEQDALRLGSLMLRHGMHVPVIRPPTVPPGTCRLRVSLSAAHTVADVDRLIAIVRGANVQLQTLPHLIAQQKQMREEGWFSRVGYAMHPDTDVFVPLGLSSGAEKGAKDTQRGSKQEQAGSYRSKL